jgi:hypothetical protein
MEIKMPIGRLLLKLENGIFVESAKEAIESFGARIIKHDHSLFLVEVDNEQMIDDINLSRLFSHVSSEVQMHQCITVDLCGMTDKDVDGMTEDEVKTKLKEIRDTALWWASQEDDDRCYLDDVKVLKSILPHGKVNFVMPDDLTFIENCIRFKRTRCPKDPKIHEW